MTRASRSPPRRCSPPTSPRAQGVTDIADRPRPVASPSPARPQELGKDMQLGAQRSTSTTSTRSGGVNGRKIVLKTLDDGYEPPRAVENTKKLINDEKVFALFGYVGTPTSNAVAADLHRGARCRSSAPFTGAESLRAPFNRYIFNVRASYFDETEAIVQHLTAMSVNKIAVFYQNDAYGQAGLAGVERALKKRNMEIVREGHGRAQHRGRGEGGRGHRARRNPQAVVMISAYKSCAAFIKEMKKAGVEPHLLERVLRRQQGARQGARQGRPRRADLAGRAVPLGRVDPGGEGIPRSCSPRRRASRASARSRASSPPR